ncbi:serine hydrolase domain-containing protein [Psychromicrobium lacuslunae]|uniref:serine hydrolase domain-containing protein n=1 Tax=Psychromicrobium lacuslunae TaxID=1618207 RepID=UPI000695E2C3|nr:serine hydrolase domain-containing protein [Psychromicrobium lacuslunae]
MSESNPESKNLQQVMQQIVETRVARAVSPSLAAAFWQRGELRASWLLGDADGQGSEPQLDTAYRIASCTKSFTAAAVLLLRERGQLNLDLGLAELLPELRIVGTGMPTVRMLLSMSAGLPTDNPWADRQESLDQDGMRKLMLGGIRLVRLPDEGYEYSNLSYALLGQLIERVSGVEYRRFIETEFLAPLGMNSTGFDQTVPASGGLAVGFRSRVGEPSSAGEGELASRSFWQPQPFSSPGQFSAIGGLFSTLRDLARWASWLSDAFTEGPTPTQQASDDAVLSRAARREMQQIHTLIGSDDGGLATGYGFGLFVQQHPERGKTVSHSGGYPGFSSQMVWHPESSSVLIGFENASYAKVGELLTALLAEILEGTPRQQAEPWPEALKAKAAVEALLWNWDDNLARSIFAENVELDKSFPERRAELGSLLDLVGPLQHKPASGPTVITAAQLAWSMPTERGELCCKISLSPLAEPLVQELELSALPESR